MPVFFTYTFVCPLCGETISSDGIVAAPTRGDISSVVLARHPTCPHCGQVFPDGKIELSVVEASPKS